MCILVVVVKEKTVTFINAFESSPVHCLKSRPSGNHCNPGNGGTADILERMCGLHLCKVGEINIHTNNQYLA